MASIHLTAYFSGRVQGVGFRYQTREIAKGFDVTGYVQNLSDGRVLLVAEAGEKELDSFLAEIEDKLSAYIRKTESSKTPELKGYTDFTIR